MRPDERDLDDELRGHLALSIRERVARGEDPDAARLAALAELGYPPDVRDSMRRVWYSRWYETFDGLRRDARFALRVLRKSPGFLLVAVATLALAIGANAVVFGVMNGLILRPLNVPHPESLYGIEHAAQHNMYESYPDYRDLRGRNRSFESLAGFTIVQTGFDTGDDSSRVWVVQATGNYFDALGVQPYLGRVFHASDERGPNSAPYLVLGYGFWRTHFNADPSIVGRVVRVNTHPFTIIGVAPEWFHGTLAIANADVYAPFVQDEQLEGRNRLEARASTAVFMALGHLKPGVTPEQAVDDLNGIGRYLETTYPSEHGATTFRLARPGLYGSYLGEPLRAFVAGLLVLSGLILLGACANLGSLFAARAADRSREIAVRLSLGASRGRILRQLMTEAVIIALAGGSVGLWGSVVLLRSLASWQPMPKFPMVVPVAPDGRVYALAVGLALLSGLLFGLVPARQVFRTDPYQVIKAGPSAMIGRRLTVRDLLLVAQVAICAVLVTASIVAVRGLGRAVHAPYGFDPRDVLLAETDLSMAGYSGGRIPEAQQQMIDRLATLPGVAGVAAIGRPPLSAGGFTVMVFHEDAAELSPQKSIATAVRYVVSPAYFQVARTSLIAGRPFSSHDDASAPRVAILNRELARRTFGAPDAALGRRLKLRDGEHVEVVGVAENGKYATLTEEMLPAIFLPLRQTPNAETWMLVRGTGDAEALAGPVRAALRAYDPKLPIYLETWDRNLDFALFAPRMATVALGVMGVIAAMLTVTGVFGMASYSVSKRMRELGIRIALGAQRRELLSAAVGRALKLLACGSIAGVALGGLASRLLAVIVYQATSRDPLVLSGVIGVMFSFGLLATWIPARRALSADPLRLLRQD